MRPGPEELEALQKEITGKMVPGDDIVILGPVGIAGTLQLLENCADRLKAVFSEGFLADAEEDCLSGRILPSDIQKLTGGREVHAMYGLGPAGFLGGLWIMAEASSAGLKLDLRRVPILQYSVEICEVTGDNPYMIPSEGAVLLSMQSGEAFASEMRIYPPAMIRNPKTPSVHFSHQNQFLIISYKSNKTLAPITKIGNYKITKIKKIYAMEMTKLESEKRFTVT